MAHVAIVLTSCSASGRKGVNFGVWLDTFAIAYYYFRDRCVDVTVASPCGGSVSVYPPSDRPDECADVKRFRSDRLARADFSDTLKITQLYPEEINGLFYAGGYGALADLADNETSQNLIRLFHQTDKPMAFVCHGPAALKNILTSQGSHLVNGVQLTCYSNAEDKVMDVESRLPYALETELRLRGAVLSHAGVGETYCVRDGSIITGQNPASVHSAASLLLKSIGVE